MQVFLKKHFWLLLIFFLALTLRLYHLSNLPLGFYEEEVTNAYVGRFIFENGRDLYGNRWPLLYFDKFGDFPPVLPLYVAGLSTYIFGLTEFAARFPTALIGALTVFPLFGLAQFLWKDKRASLLTVLFLAIAPWHVVLSRTSAEGIIGFGVYTWAIFGVVRGVGEGNIRKIRRALVLFTLGYFLHPGLRIIVPLTLLPLPWFTKNKKLKRILLFASLGAFILTGVIAMTPWGKGRFLQTSVFHSSEVRDRIHANMEALSYGEGQNNIVLARVFHNKVVGYSREFIRQYMSYFAPEHLFLQAGGQARYFNVPYQGLLFVTIFGLITLSLLPGVTEYMRYIIYLAIITPLPSVLTVDFVPHAHRSLFLLLPLLLLATSGFIKLVRSLPKRIPHVLPVLLILLVLLIESIYFWHQYSRHEAANQSILRNVGDKEVVHWIIAHKGEYDKIIMPPFARLPIYYLYFTGNFNPGLIGRFTSQLQLDQVDTIEFARDWCPTKYLTTSEVSKKTLIVENGDCGGNPGFTRIELMYRADSTKSYRMMVVD